MEHDKDGNRSAMPPEEASPRDDAPDTLLDRRLMELLRICAHTMRHKSEGRGGQRRILHILDKRGTVTQRELMDILDIRSASLSEILGKLEASGCIERHKNEDDRRSVDVTLTEAGRSALAPLQEQYRNEVVPRLFAHLTTEEKQQLTQLLERLVSGWDRGPHGHGRHGIHGTEHPE